jgi:amidohydrolase
LIENFETLHQYPEIGFFEFKTSEFIQKKLEEYGIEYKVMARTGVVGDIVTNPSGKTIALRADIDALPIDENTDLDYKSKNAGMMHACGHDGHVCMLLAAARYLSEHKSDLEGNVRFIFQPSEEGIAPAHYDELIKDGVNPLGGAATMVDEGAMDGVDAVFAIHGDSGNKKKTIKIAKNKAMASSDRYTVEIIGKGGHGAMPDTAIDPTGALAAIINAFNQLPSRECSALDNLVISIGEIHAEGTWNAIPGNITLTGTVRTFDEKLRRHTFERMEEIVEYIAKAHRCDYKFERIESTMATINDEKMVALVERTANEIFGQEISDMYMPPQMGAEDVANFFNVAPGAMAWLGEANEDRENYPLHNPNMVVNKDALIYGAYLHISVVMNYFKGE